MNETRYLSKGWQCPKCSGILAPWVDRCDDCAKDRQTFQERIARLAREFDEILEAQA